MERHGESRLAHFTYLALGIGLVVLTVGWVVLYVAAIVSEGLAVTIVAAVIAAVVWAQVKKDKREGVQRY